MYVRYKVVIDDNKTKYPRAGATNEFVDETHVICEIFHYLKNFNYRKNISYIKVAKHIDDYFFMEFLCALLRQNHDNDYIPCNGNNSLCPPYLALKKCRKLLKRRKNVLGNRS